jgi:hypothetical protein
MVTMRERSPDENRVFSSFGKSNLNYKPNDYSKNESGKWYQTRQQPCCSVPCRSCCKDQKDPFSHLSPPKQGAVNIATNKY